MSAPAVVTAPVATVLRLDLGCGQNPKDGFEGVDLWSEQAKHRIDLFKFPWPWADSSVDEMRACHFVEHVPLRDVEGRDFRDGADPSVQMRYFGKDMLVAFMDEAWRVLKPGAHFHVEVPNARHNRAWQDPTHRRFFVMESFAYFTRKWRDEQKLGHYLGECDFEISVVPIVPTELTLLHPEAQARRFGESWNTVLDWVADMKARKP